MAESDKIKSQDLIQDNVFDNTTKSAKALEQELSKLVIGFEGIIKANAEMLKLNKDPKTAAGIKEVNAALIENEKLRKAIAIAERELIKNGSEQLKQDRELLKLSREREKQEQQNLRQQQAQNSAYKQASDRLRDIKKELKDLSISGKTTTDQFKRLNDEFKELDGRVRAADATVGDFQRNVGNYQGKFNGLGNSINQLTREMPAFANSMQTGFMAISNNLPIFFDEISKVKSGLAEMQAEGKKAPSLFQTITSSIFTLGTALSIGVTLLTVYGKELANVVIGLFEADKAFKMSADKQKEYNKIFLDSTNKRIEALLKINVLTDKWTQEQADNFRKSRAIDLERQEAAKRHAAVLVEIARKYRVNISQLTGDKKGSIMRSDLTFLDLEAVAQMNKDVLAARKLFYEDLARIRKDATVDEQLDALEKAAKEKDTDKKATEEKIKNTKDYVYNLKQQLNEKLKAEQYTSDKSVEATENELKEKEELLKRYEKDYEEITKIGERIEQEKQDRIQMLEQMTTNFLKQELDKRNKLEQDAINRKISADEKRIQRQFELAKEGLNNQLAFEEQTLAKDQLKRKEQQEKEQKQKERIALAEAYLNAYNAELKKYGANPTTAAGKALADVLIAKGIAKGISSFFDGTEDTGSGGNIDNKGGFAAILHPNERVMTAEQNKKVKGLSNEELADVASKFNNGQLVDLSKQYNLKGSKSFAENISNSILIQQNKEILNSLKAIEDKPVQLVDVVGLHNRLDMIETLVYSKHKDVIVHRGKVKLR